MPPASIGKASRLIEVPDNATAPVSRNRRRPIVRPLAVFVLLAVVLTWPLARQLGTHIPGAPPGGDNLAFLWTFWWVREVLASSTPLFRTAALFHPYGADLAMHTHAFLNALVGATLFSSLSIVAAQNVVIIASLALNGFCTYLLAWRFTRHEPAALIAGLYFACSPYFAGHLPGHFNLTSAWPLPLFALLWLRAIERPSYAIAAAAGLLLAVATWTDYYYASFLIVFAVVSLLTRWTAVGWRTVSARPSQPLDRLIDVICLLLFCTVVAIRLTGGGVFFISGVRISATTGLPPLTVMWALIFIRLWRRWRPVPLLSLRDGAAPTRDLALASLAAGVALAGILPILREAARLWRGGSYVTPPGFLRSAARGVDPVALLAGNPFHAAWGGVVMRIYDAAGTSAVENTAWFGVVAIGLLVATRAFAALPVEMRLWRVVAAVFFVWSLGPYLSLFGQNTGLYLPAALLRLLPVVDNVRIPGRAIVMVYLAVSVLLARALVSMPWLRGRTRMAIVAGLILVDFAAAPPPLMRLDVPPLYAALAPMPPGGVLELPMGLRDGYGQYGALDHRTLYYQSVHGKPIAGGFIARMPDRLKERHLESPLYGPLLTLSAGGVPAAGQLAALREDAAPLLAASRIRYVVLSRHAPAALREVVAGWPLRLVTSDADRELFEVR